MSSTRSRRKKHETARQNVSRVRIRRAGARLQRRPYAGAVPDGARQDSAEPAVGHVRAAPATARDRDQAGAPAGAAALHQGIRRLTVGRWLGLVALSFAALRLAARPGSRREWLVLAGAGGAAVALLLGPAAGLLDALDRAWIVLVSVAFAAGAAVRPLPGARFWPLALRACLYTAAGVAILGQLAVGSAVWQQVQWEATRDASGAVRRVIEFAPGLYPAFELAVRLLAAGWPVWLALGTLLPPPPPP